MQFFFVRESIFQDKILEIQLVMQKCKSKIHKWKRKPDKKTCQKSIDKESCQ